MNSWEVLVPRGVPSGAPGLDFGPPWAPFWVPFRSVYFLINSWSKFRIIFYCVLAPSGDSFGVILETFWCTNFNVKSVTFSRTSQERMWEPPATSTGSKSLVFIVLSFKVECRAFRVGEPLGAALEANMERKWMSKSTQSKQKHNSKISLNFDPKSDAK